MPFSGQDTAETEINNHVSKLVHDRPFCECWILLDLPLSEEASQKSHAELFFHSILTTQPIIKEYHEEHDQRTDQDTNGTGSSHNQGTLGGRLYIYEFRFLYDDNITIHR